MNDDDRRSLLVTGLIEVLIGAFIAYGGFGEILPRFFNALEGIVSLETFKALRVFSLIYFLLPACFIVLWFWLFRGNKLYFAEKTEERGLMKTWVSYYVLFPSEKIILGVSLALPLIAFFSEQFIIIEQIKIIGQFQYWMIPYYGVVMLLILFCTSYDVFHNITAKDKIEISQIKRIITNYRLNAIIYSIGIVLATGALSIMVPWFMYSDYFQVILIGSIAVYSLLALCGFFVLNHYIKKKYPVIIEKEELDQFVVQTYYQLTFFLIVLITLGSIFPSLSWDHSIPMIVVIIFALFAVVLILIARMKWKSKRKKSNYIQLTFTALLSLFIIFYIIKPFYLGLNQHYLENRLKASALVSNAKILPIFIFNDSTEIAKENLDKSVQFIESLNTANRNKGELLKKDIDSLLNEGHYERLQVNSKSYDELKKDYSIRAFFYNKYNSIDAFWDSDSEPKLLKSDIYEHIKANYHDTKEISEFYDSLYHYIDGIIEGTIKKTNNRLKSHNNITHVSQYYHPINYYGANLRYFSSQLSLTRQLKDKIELTKEIALLISANDIQDQRLVEIMKSHAKLAERLANEIRELKNEKSMIADHFIDKNSDYWKLHELLSNTITLEKDTITTKELIKTINSTNSKQLEEQLSNLNLSVPLGSIVKYWKLKNYHQNEIERLSQRLLILEQFKIREYRERYERAQKIFLPYLTDAQRAGVFIFVSALIILLFAGFHNHNDAKDTTAPKKLPYDAPRFSIYVWCVVLLVLLLPLVRNIEPKMINPEHPTWIIMLSTWSPPALTKINNLEDIDPFDEEKGSGPSNKELLQKLDELKKSQEESKEILIKIDGK